MLLTSSDPVQPILCYRHSSLTVQKLAHVWPLLVIQSTIIYSRVLADLSIDMQTGHAIYHRL